MTVSRVSHGGMSARINYTLLYTLRARIWAQECALVCVFIFGVFVGECLQSSNVYIHGASLDYVLSVTVKLHLNGSACSSDIVRIYFITLDM